jgi:alkylhydroperoxidase family enzyme
VLRDRLDDFWLGVPGKVVKLAESTDAHSATGETVERLPRKYESSSACRRRGHAVDGDRTSLGKSTYLGKSVAIRRKNPETGMEASKERLTERAMDTFLAPIEKPDGLMMKLVYAMTRRQFGKVPTPVKVFAARLPLAFGMFVGRIGKLDKKLTLPAETVMLIREQVARINVCLFCIDIGRSFTIKAKMNQAKFDALENYSTSPLFTDAERAALDYVTELTRDKQVNPGTFARMAGYYSERVLCEIAWLVASEHFYNMTNIGLNIHSDMLCDIVRKTSAVAH